MPWSPRQARYPLAVLTVFTALLLGALTTPASAGRPEPSRPTTTASGLLAPGLSTQGLSTPGLVPGLVPAGSETRTKLLPQRKGLGAALRRMRRLVNVVRLLPHTCGDTVMPAAPPIRRNKRLDRAATKYARKMARNDWFDHLAPDGAGPGERINDQGYRWSAWGENIAAGYQAVPSVLSAWLDSPSHCRTLMSPYRHVGFGYAYARDSTFGHYWVQDFATPA